MTLAIAYSGAVANKTGAAMEAYNRASRLARAVVEHWNAATGRHDPHMAAAFASSPDAPSAMAGILRRASDPVFPTNLLLARYEQFHAEANQILPQAGDALLGHDWPVFGQLVHHSQHLTETKLANQIPETIFLARSARQLGAIAASAFGAGFGGSVWAMVPSADATNFLADWQRQYQSQFPAVAASAAFFPTRPAPAALAIDCFSH